MRNEEKLEKIFSTLLENIELPEEHRQEVLNSILSLKNRKINILITGATGSGKSSTINALFGKEITKVGNTANPETMKIERYEVIENIVIWDSPGLGDGLEQDNKHSKAIINKLYDKNSEGDLLIDLVLVIIDGSSRDLGTACRLINKVIIPNLGKNPEKRIIVAINKADQTGGPRDWDYENNKPSEKLQAKLNEQIDIVSRRIYESTKVNITPVYYSAGYRDDEVQYRPYNLSKLYSKILSSIPSEKRIVIANNINEDVEVWKDDDGLEDYDKSILNSIIETGVSIIKQIPKLKTVVEVGEKAYKVTKTIASKLTSWFGF